MKIRDWNKNLQIRLVGEFFTNASLWMTIPYLVIYYSQQLGGSLTAGLLMVSAIVGVVANLIGGYLSNRHDKSDRGLQGGVFPKCTCQLFSEFFNLGYFYAKYV